MGGNIVQVKDLTMEYKTSNREIEWIKRDMRVIGNDCERTKEKTVGGIIAN